MRCEERFYEIYGKDPVGISFCPYRICPIGAHSDHNLGKITGVVDDGTSSNETPAWCCMRRAVCH